MTDEERRRYLVYAQAAAHLKGAANLLSEFEPDLARRLRTDADCMYAEAKPLLDLLQPDPRFEHPDERVG